MRKVFCLFIMVLLTGCNLVDSLLSPSPTLTVDPQAVETMVAQMMEPDGDGPKGLEETVIIPNATTFPPLETLSLQPVPTDIFTPLPTLDPRAVSCKFWPEAGAAQPLPEVSSLSWEVHNSQAGRWLALSSLTSPVLAAESAPGGRWWAARILSGAAKGPSPWQTALYILDGVGDDHWVASLSGQVGYQQHIWLTNNRLAWVDEGRLWIASGDGSDRQDLFAPEPVYEVWGGRSALALVSGETGLWRLDINSAAWQRVAELDEIAARLGSQPFSRGQANLAVMPDGSFAGLTVASNLETSAADLWRIPFSMADPAVNIFAFSYLGRGGRMEPPTRLGSSPYWYPGQMAGPPDNFDAIEYVLLDEQNGTRLPLRTLLPEGMGLLSVWVSPDSQWLGLAAAPQTGNPAEVEWLLVFVSANNLEDRFVINGDSVLSWRSFPPAAWVVDHNQTALVVKQISLPGGIEHVLSEFASTAVPKVVSTADAAFLLSSDQIQVFDLDGNLRSQYPAPVLFTELYASSANPVGQVLLSGVQAGTRDGSCTYTFPLIQWLVP